MREGEDGKENRSKERFMRCRWYRIGLLSIGSQEEVFSDCVVKVVSFVKLSLPLLHQGFRSFVMINCNA